MIDFLSLIFSIIFIFFYILLTKKTEVKMSTDFETFNCVGDYIEEYNKFVKIGKVGKGTYGYVYKAYPKPLPGNYYALKKIKIDMEMDSGFPITA